MITEADAKKMSKEERLEAVHMLWDSLIGNPDDPPESPEWHATVLAERTAKFEAGEEQSYTVGEAWGKLEEFKAHSRRCGP
jgi:hypothetical protein